MDLVCPLCRAGRLESQPRSLQYEGSVLATSVHQCPTCRESLLSPDQLEELRRSIREAGIADAATEIDAIVERVLLQPE